MNTSTIYHRDGRSETLEASAAGWRVRNDSEWSFHVPPPPGWERETPKYRASRNIEPAQKERFRFEPPFGTGFASDVWQYGERPYKRGEIIETRSWPHESFEPLNYSAEKVLEFFKSRMKSRMTLSPWFGDQVRLDDGMSGFIPQSLGPVQLPKFDPTPVPFGRSSTQGAK